MGGRVLLTQRQLQLLTYIHTYVREHRVPPSFEEMRNALKLKSKSGVHRLVSGLEERGYIRRLAYRARALEIVRSPHDDPSPNFELPAGSGLAMGLAEGPVAPPDFTDEASSNIVRGHFRAGPRSTPSSAQGNRSVPLVGRIAAGVPIEALQHGDRRLGVPADMLATGAEHYALEGRGDSMIDAGILDGDLVVIRRQDSADSGDIVVALIEGHEATLKRLRHHRGGRVALEAANPAYETRILGADQVAIQGRLVGLVRTY